MPARSRPLPPVEAEPYLQEAHLLTPGEILNPAKLCQQVLDRLSLSHPFPGFLLALRLLAGLVKNLLGPRERNDCYTDDVRNNEVTGIHDDPAARDRHVYR